MTIVVEETQLDAFGDLGEQREVDAVAVVGRAERKVPSRPDVVGYGRIGAARFRSIHAQCG